MDDVKYVELHGQHLAYREAGTGEVVVLLHGMAASSQTWRAVMARLAKRYRVVAPDLLGHGDSAKPRTDYSLGAFAVGLRDLFDVLGISRATMVGHSLGGGVAMQFLYQHPQYCHRLILVSSGGLGPDVGWVLRLLAAPGAEFVLPVIAAKVVATVGDRARSWLSTAGLSSPMADQIWQAYSSLSDPPSRAAFLRTLRSVVDYQGQSVSALSRLRLCADVPTLVLWGDRDPIIPVEHGYAVQAARPDCSLKVLVGVGHFPHVECPCRVAAAIEDFLTDSSDDTAEHGADELPSMDCGMAEGLPGILAEQRFVMQDFVDDLESRQQIEVALGILMDLRKCSQPAAVSEFSSAVKETGVAPRDLARALSDLLGGGDGSSPQRAQAQRRWGHLLALRGLNEDPSAGATVDTTVRVPYGPENSSTIC